MPHFVDLTATNAARLFGLDPRKGGIAAGSDADIVVWDDTREVKVSLDLLHGTMDYTPYEGRKLRGWTEHVNSRGEIIVEDGQVRVDRGRRESLPWELPEPARPGAAFDRTAGSGLSQQCRRNSTRPARFRSPPGSDR